MFQYQSVGTMEQPYGGGGVAHAPYPTASSLVVGTATVRYAAEESEDPSAAEKAKAAIIMLLGIIAAVIGMVLVTYCLSYMSDRWSGSSSTLSAEAAAAAFRAQFDHTALARKARLWGLKLEERARILEAFFRKRLVVFQDKQKVDNNNDDDETTLREAETKPDGEKADYAATCDESEGVSSTSEHTSNRKEGDVAKDKGSEPVEGEQHVKESKVRSDGFHTQDDVETGNVSGKEEDKANATEQQQTGEEEVVDNKEALKDADHERICCICMIEYKTGDQLITGARCSHIFHYSCCMEWLNTPHDECPYCRVEMLSASQFRKSALEVLGPRRVAELGNTVTASPFSSTLAL